MKEYKYWKGVFQVPSTSQTLCITSQTCCCFPQKMISTCHSVCKISSSNACKIEENLANDSRNVKLILLILIPFKGICYITM